MEYKKPLQDDELVKLLTNLKVDPTAKERIILHNLRLVHWVAKKYYKPEKNEFDDLFQVGVMGLMRAIEIYNPDKGSFSNYAILWIRQFISRYIYNHQRIIRIPVYLVNEINKVKNAQKQLMKDLGREPKPQEISRKLDMDIYQVLKILNVLQDPVSLELVISKDDNLTLMDIIPSNDNPYERVIEKIFVEDILARTKTELTDLEYNVLINHYGLHGKAITLKEIGEKYNESAESIRVAKQNALRKIRHSEFIIRDYIERQVDRRTIFIRGTDYTQARSSNRSYNSAVESIFFQREDQK
jgi:RNA polymerase primary sigma factor